MIWRHVPGEENPAGIGSRGETISKLNDLWLNGPEWLQDEGNWPSDIVPTSSAESECEARAIKEVLSVCVENVTVKHKEEMLQNFGFWKCIRILSWMQRFIANCQRIKQKRTTDN